MTVTADPSPEPPLTGPWGQAIQIAKVVWQQALRLYEWARRQPAWLQITVFLLALIALSVFERTRTIDGQFWMDEAITVGIASHPLTAIPGVLRMDGSPPLFYMLLHLWMLVFGRSEAATHVLSLLFATLAIPVGYWGALKIIGKRAAVFAAVLFTASVFLTAYSQETRMYALMAFLGLLATIGFVRGFVFRERRYVALFSISEVLMLYTHAWALFYGAASFLSLVLLWRLADEQQRENFIKDAVLAYAAVALIYLPWLPTFIYQVQHTAAPWDRSPRFGLVIQVNEGVIGSNSLGAIAYLSTIFGLWTLFGRRKARTREAQVMYMLFTLMALTFASAWISSQITPAWVLRYFAPTVAPLLLLLAFGMSRARWVGVLGLLAICSVFLYPTKYAPPNKSNMRTVSGEIAPYLHPGDLVIVGQPEQTPLAYYYLPGGLRFANTAQGLVKDPSFMNWVNVLPKYRAAKPDKLLPPLLNSLKPGQQVLYIQPLTEYNSNWLSSWTSLIRLRSAQWGAIIAADKQLKPEVWAPHNFDTACCVADSAVLYKKVS